MTINAADPTVVQERAGHVYDYLWVQEMRFVFPYDNPDNNRVIVGYLPCDQAGSFPPELADIGRDALREEIFLLTDLIGMDAYLSATRSQMIEALEAKVPLAKVLKKSALGLLQAVEAKKEPELIEKAKRKAAQEQRTEALEKQGTDEPLPEDADSAE